MKRPAPTGRLARFATRVTAIAVLLVAAGSPASAGKDDFEFGQKLAQRGYFDLAKKVYEGILADAKRSDADKDKARYGMALLGKDEAYGAAGRAGVPYADVKTKFELAATAINEFVTKYPDDKKADEGRIEVGKVLLDFTSWASDLAEQLAGLSAVEDPEIRKGLEARKTDVTTCLADAQSAVNRAIQLFDGLRTSAKAQATKDLAEYFYATAQFARGKVYPKCSPEAMAAFKEAAQKLDDYATENEENLLGMYALDVLGLTQQERAQCESDPKERTSLYRKAMEWFVACAELPDDGPDHLAILSRGYWHLGKLGNEAGRQEGVDFAKEATKYLAKMTAQRPRTKKHEFGVRAMLEWAKLEAKKEKCEEAIGIATDASDSARAAGLKREVELEANAVLAGIVKTCGSGGGGGDPSVMMKVAESAFAAGKWAEAIAAFQRVIAAAPRTAEGLLTYVVPSWKRIGTCFRNLKRPLEAAVAFDAVIDEVRAGRLPKSGPVMADAAAAGDQEKAALKELGDATGDATIRARLERLAKELVELFKDYLDVADPSYGLGVNKFNSALAERDAEAPTWKDTMRAALPSFQVTADSTKSEKQDNAKGYLVRIRTEVGEHEEAVKTADGVLAWWETADAKKLVAGNDRMETNRKVERAKLLYYKGSSLNELKRWDDAAAILDGYAKKHPEAPELIRNFATGLMVQIWISKKEIQKADDLLVELIRTAPNYHLLPKIVFALASVYVERASAIEERLKKVTDELVGSEKDRAAGLLPRLSKLMKEENQYLSTLSDIQNGLKVLRTRREDPNLTKHEQEELDRQIADTEKRRTETSATLEKARKDRTEIDAKVAALREEALKIRAELVGPSALAAEKYKQWDDAVKLADSQSPANARKKRDPSNVLNFANRFFKLAILKPDAVAYWTTARELYEDYLAFDAVAKLPVGEPGKRQTLGRLGEVYYHLAEVAKDPKEAASLYERAVDHLQNVLADNPANTRLVVGLLSGEYVTIQYPDLVLGRRSIPVRRQPDVAAFRAHVKELGGELVPKYADARADERWRDMLKRFKEKIESARDDEVGRIVKSLKDAGFDFLIFGELADTSSGFLLALAHSYARSGAEENAQKALNAAQAIWSVPRTKAEDDSAEWWEARTIVLNVYVAIAERKAQSAPEAPEGKQSAIRAQEMMLTIKRLYPHLGGPARHEETLAEWLAIQARLRTVLSKLGVAEKAVDLRAEEAPKPTEPEEPPAPPDGPPGMSGAAPGGAGMAGMDEGAKDESAMNGSK